MRVTTPLWTVLRSRQEFGDEELPLLTVKSESGVSLRDLAEGRQPSEDLAGYRRVRPGDLVVNKLWARFGAYGVAPLDGVISPAYWVLKVDQGRVVPRYLHNLLRSPPYLAEIGRVSKDMPPNGFDLPWSQFRHIVVDLPPLDEQRRIADFLDTETARIDAIASARTEQALRVSERAQAVLDFTLETLALTYESRPLRRELFSIEQGSSPQCEARQADPGGYGVLKLSAVSHGRYLENENKALPNGVPGALRYEVRAGDLLMSRANTPDRVGDVAFVRTTRPGLLLPDLIYRLALRRPSDAEFVAAALRWTRVRAQISATARGTSPSMVKLRGEDIAALTIPAAPPPERVRAVLTVRSAEEAARVLQSRISTGLALLSERRQALITAAVTGQLDVTTARGGSS